MRNFDFSSWDGILSALIGIALFAFIGVGIRLVMMMTIQQRRERLNRQINERLKTLIAAYKVLGGSFTGTLTVDPTHLRDLHNPGEGEGAGGPILLPANSERARRIRDAVEAGLSDIILLGTEEQVRLAARAAADLATGRPVHTDELVVALRDFIRKALDLDAIPDGLAIPRQGPTRPSGSAGRGAGRDERRQGGGGGGAGGGGSGGGMGAGMGMGGIGGGAGSDGV